MLKLPMAASHCFLRFEHTNERSFASKQAASCYFRFSFEVTGNYASLFSLLFFFGTALARSLNSVRSEKIVINFSRFFVRRNLRSLARSLGSLSLRPSPQK